MPRPRILLSINAAWNIYNFRSGLIRALLEAGFEVITCAPEDGYEAKLEALGSRFVPLPMDNSGTNPLRDGALFLRYLRILARERPDVYLGYTIKPNVYGSLACHRLGIPVINNVSGLGTAFIRNNWLTRWVKALYRQALRRSATVFFQNEDDRSLFLDAELVRATQTQLLPGSGIDLERFQPQSKEPNPSPVFLLVARLLWDKGVGEFVEAARLVREQHPSARFQLLGFLGAGNRTAVPRESVEQWVDEGLVEYLGDTDDVRPFIAAADCVVLPSYREGTPRSLLEAAAMAKPLVATDVPGCRQIVDDGKNGYLCEVRNADDLAAKLERFIGLPPAEKARMGENGRLKMENEFDEQIVIRRYLAAIRGILDARLRAAIDSPADG
ncbi:MAG: glycosyltransferase family 4 protein [Acidobacteriota bacterium]